MKKSIRYKLMIYMVATIAIFVLTHVVASFFFVERFYIAKKKESLIKTSNHVAEIFENVQIDEGQNSFFITEEEFSSIITLERLEGQSIGIHMSAEKMPELAIDSISIARREDIGDIEIQSSLAQNEYYFSDGSRGNMGLGIGKGRIIQGAAPHKVEIIEMIDDTSFFSKTHDNALGVQTLSYRKTLDNGFIIAVATPMSAISDAVQIYTNFTAYMGIVGIALTLLWAWYTSYSFTKPITKITSISKKMSALDFSEIIEIDGNDEIADLATSINHLSSSLYSTINELNVKNHRLSEELHKEQKLDELRRSFISSVSHELKTPIFLILGYCEGLQKNFLTDTKKEFYLNVINEEAEKMDNLVKDLLNVVRLETVKKEELDLSTYNVHSFLSNITTKYGMTLQEQNIDFTFSCPNDIYAKFDFTKMEQVVTNFINNALEHIDEKKEISLHGDIEGDYIKISIFNKGNPIPSEHLDKIWISFYKADQSRRRTIGGAGLGLSIVKAVLDAHGFTYGVENKEDGVNFYFTMPISDEEIAENSII